MPDTKIKMLLNIKDRAEMILVINANDIEKHKMRSDIGITYSQDLFRLIDAFKVAELAIGGVVITQYAKQREATKLRKKLEKSGIKCAYHYKIENYPNDIDRILSKDGFGKNEYLETNKEIVVVTAPGPGSGKMAVALSQIYHDNLHDIKSGYAKFETFPVWNLPLNHPVNLAYEAATANLSDVNMIDPFHLQEYGKVAINYNRDVEAFPVLNNLLTKVIGECIYKSPTDMGVNMVGYCISDDEACREASNQEIIRRCYQAQVDYVHDKIDENVINKLENILTKSNISKDDRKVAVVANELAKKTGEPVTAIELVDGTIVTGKLVS